MLFCPHCKIEQFGGSRCSHCGRRLIEGKASSTEAGEAGSGSGLSPSGCVHSRPLPRHIEMLDRESRYKVERKRPPLLFYIGAFFVRCLESIAFCTIFHFVLITMLFMFSAITELTRTGGEIYISSWLKELRQGIRFYEYFAFALITLMTFKYRWPKR